jgi:hypothetical protein
VNGVETVVAVCGFAGDAAEVVAGYVAGLSPGVGVIPGCKTGFSKHPDKITKAITRPVTRENTILLFNPASLPNYADEFYGPSGKYIFTYRISRCPAENQKTSFRDRQILRPARWYLASVRGVAMSGPDGEGVGTPVRRVRRTLLILQVL